MLADISLRETAILLTVLLVLCWDYRRSRIKIKRWLRRRKRDRAHRALREQGFDCLTFLLHDENCFVPATRQ